MNLWTSLFASILAVVLVTNCEKQKTSAENEELKRRIDQLEQERREAAERRQAATEEELSKAREQLQLALDALEKEQAGAAEKPEVDVKDAGKAVVVPEPRPNEGAKDPAQGAERDDYRVFFRELAPFGEWIATDDYAYMWQPQVARKDRSWHPYTRGRWLLAEEGWTWVSEEPFGWATFHYGRWALLENHGWAWVPGDEWAPSWVSWRQSDQYVGWAPLPPETLYNEKHVYTGQVDTIYDLAPSWYSFVPVARFQDSIAPHCVPPQSVMAIVAQSENVTDVRARKDGIYSGGPNERWLAPHVGGGVQRCSIARHRSRAAGGRFEQLQGGKLNLFAPAVNAPWNPAVRPQNISAKWGRISVVRGGGAMDQAALARYRAENLARQEAARRAIEREEVQQALLRDRRAREEAARQATRQCSPDVHGQLERTYTGARRAVEEAEARLAQPSLNPKQLKEARARLDEARTKLAIAEKPFADHMLTHHPDDYRRVLEAEARRRAEQSVAEERRRKDVLANEQAARAAEEAARQAEAVRRAQAETERQARVEAERQARAEAERQARAEAARLAQEEAARQAQADAARKAEMEAKMRSEAERRAREAAAEAEAARRAEEEQRKRTVCDPAEHRQLEAAYESARAEFEAAQAKMNAGNLNPKQLAYARQIAGAASRKQSSTEQAWLAHLEKHHAQDHKRLLAERAQESARQRAEDQAREAKRLADEQARVEAEKARMEEESRAAALAKAEAERVAQERRKSEEARRQAAARERDLAEARAREQAARKAELPKPSPEPVPEPAPATKPGCSPAVHNQLEAAFKAAQAAADLAQKRVDDPNANPKQLAYSRKALDAATQRLKGATAAYDKHMAEFHPDEWEKLMAERAAAGRKSKEGAKGAKKGKQGGN